MEQFFQERLVTILVLVGSFVVLTILFFSFHNRKELVDAAGWIEHTQEVLLESDKLATDVRDIQVDGRVYLVTQNKDMLRVVASKERSASERIERLRELVSDNPSQILKVDSLHTLLIQHTNLDLLMAAQPEASNPLKKFVLELFVQSKAYEEKFIKVLTEFQAEEYRLLTVRKKANEDEVARFERLLMSLLVGYVIVFLLIIMKVRQSERLRSKLTQQNISLTYSIKDISDYKHALDESAIVAITNQRGIITHVNDNFCKISKYKREELMGQDHRIINSSYHSKEFFRTLWQTIAQGQIWKGEIRNQAKDGSFYWVDTTIVPFLDDDGRPYQYLAIRSDITERKTAEDVKAANRRLGLEIQEKKAELAGVLDKILDGFMVLDKNFNYIYVNRKLGEMTHKDPAWLTGRNAWDVFPEVVGSPSYNAIMEAIRDQKYVTHMDYFPPLDLWHENHIYPNEEGVSIFVRDVSKQMRAEQKRLESERLYKAIASTIPGSVICIVDHEFRYMLVEGDMVSKLGYSKQTVVGKTAAEFLPKDRYEETVPYFKRAFNGEVFGVEMRRGEYDLLTRYVPLKDQHGNIHSIMVASIDVTALKNAEREAAELNMSLERRIAERTTELERVNQELEAFSYSVAHDLRSPLRAVRGYATMLIEDHSPKFDDDAKVLLSKLDYNATRMSTLIDDLLSFSKLGKKEVRKSVVDMEAVVGEVLKELDHGRAKIHYEKLHPVFGDMSLIKHVISNLLSNAVKYSSKVPEPEILIASACEDEVITYSVTDNGAGFDMQYAQGLFNVFRRLHSSESFEGTGVGLAIVKRIINRHGGNVWAHSKVDHGATFFFTLPAIPRV